MTSPCFFAFSSYFARGAAGNRFDIAIKPAMTDIDMKSLVLSSKFSASSSFEMNF